MRPLQREAAKHQQHQQHQQSEDERAEEMPQQQQEGGHHQSKKDTQTAQRQQTSSPNSSAPFSSTRRVGARGGPQLFAQKLFTLVDEEDPAIVEWLPDGLAFRVKDIQRFSNEVLEKYFNHSKFTSFQRQLNLYQFKRRKGAHAGAFHHPCFKRGQRHLLSKVRRQKVKRDLAVEARAAQKLARTREGRHGHRSSEKPTRGRTRAATQADLRPVRSMQAGDEDPSDGECTPGSRRSALRRRVSSDPSTSDVDGMENDGDESSSNEDTWPTDRAAEVGRFSSTKEREWGEDWRRQATGSPQRSPEEMHHLSTPMTPQSSDFEYSSYGSLDRMSSARSSLTSSSSLGSSPSNAEAFHSSRYPFDGASSYSSQSPTTPSDTPAEQTLEAMQAAQVTAPEHSLSLAAMVDASMGDWISPSNSMSLRQFEPFGWGSSLVDGNASSSNSMAATGEPTSTVTQHPQLPGQPPHQDDFGFIDLFSVGVEEGGGAGVEEGSSALAASSLNPEMIADGKMDGFMKEVEAAGVFGLEDFLLPRGSYAGPAGYA